MRRVPAWRRGLRPYLLSVPAVLLIIGILYAFFYGVYYTVLNYAATNPAPTFVGLDNYRSVLGDPLFWRSAGTTLLYAVAATGLETVLGVAIALLLNRSTLIGKTFERLLILRS